MVCGLMGFDFRAGAFDRSPGQSRSRLHACVCVAVHRRSPAIYLEVEGVLLLLHQVLAEMRILAPWGAAGSMVASGCGPL